jgi:C_GCAxxG_C_C family probable redox protein
MSEQRPETEAFVAEARRLTEEACDSGLHCAEAVASALAKVQGIDSELVPGVATAFCGGMSLTGGPCGALTGAIIGLGLTLGRRDVRQPVIPIYAATQELVRTFEKEFGGRHCEQLLGCDIATPEGREQFNRQELYKRCERYTIGAAETAATLLSRSTE